MKYKKLLYVVSVALLMHAGYHSVSALEMSDECFLMEEVPTDDYAIEIELDTAEDDQTLFDEAEYIEQDMLLSDENLAEDELNFSESEGNETLSLEQTGETDESGSEDDFFSDDQNSSDTKEDAPFEYSTENQIVTITKCNDTSEIIEVPSKINGLPVRVIGKDAFRNLSTMKKLILPNGIKQIEEYAFYGCSLLSEVVLPGQLEFIGAYGFAGCNKLLEVVLPKSVATVNSSVFHDCSRLILYRTLQNNTLELYVFQREANTSFSMPQTVQGKTVSSIGEYAFSEAPALETVKIPSTVTQIHAGAFCRCTQLKSITIPNSVTVMESAVFYGCINLKTVNLSANITSIGNSMFSECLKLTQINLPEKVTRIEESAFYRCTSLSKVYIPAQTTAIASNAFQKCPSSITISGYNGTSAEKFAVKHNFRFKNLGLAYPLIKQIVSTEKGMKLIFSIIPEAQNYKIYRKDSTGGSYTLIQTLQNNTSGKEIKWVDQNVTSGKYYTYTVKSYANGKVSDKHPDVTCKYLAAPALESCTNSASGIKITWKPIKGANGYIVYRKQGNGSWKKIRTLDQNYLAYTDTSITGNSGTVFYYTVKSSANNGTIAGAYNTKGISGIYFNRLKFKTIKNKTNGLKLSWDAMKGAEGYYIYRKTSSTSFKKIADVKGASSNSFVDETVKMNNGNTFIYAIRAYRGAFYSPYQEYKTVRLQSNTITSCMNHQKTGMKVSWNKNDRADGYEIYYKDGQTSNTVSLNKNNILYRQILNLTVGTTYKIYVRSYKVVDQIKYYSAWSPCVTCRIQK